MLQAELNHLHSGYEASVPDEADDALVVTYPKHCDEYGSGYIQPRVLIETGGRAAQTPKENHSIQAMVSAVGVAEEIVEVSVLSIARTFFEKVTAIHAFHCQRRVEDRSSRHLYDIHQIFQAHPHLAADLKLLNEVASHKQKYFRAAAAKYDEAQPGRLKLSISKDEGLRCAFEQDWAKMAEMFPAERPDFETLERSLKQIDDLINRKAPICLQVIDWLEYWDKVDEPSYQKLAWLFPKLRSLGITKAHSLSLRILDVQKQTTDPEARRGRTMLLLNEHH